MDVSQIRLVEELAANAWRAEIEQSLDGWRLRASGGDSRRVNSVWASADQGSLPLAHKLEMAEEFYMRRGLTPRFQLCAASLPPSLPEALAERGYRDHFPTSVRSAPLETVWARCGAASHQIEVFPQLDDLWFQTYTSASGYSPESLAVRRGILERVGPKSAFALLRLAGEAAATGLGVVERGWLGVFCVVTYAHFRRQGLATQVMRALAEWGAREQVGKVYLQVMDDNRAALSLYEKLGFSKLYQYWYAEKSS